jgi:hypothetical protein
MKYGVIKKPLNDASWKMFGDNPKVLIGYSAGSTADEDQFFCEWEDYEVRYSTSLFNTIQEAITEMNRILVLPEIEREKFKIFNN